MRCFRPLALPLQLSLLTAVMFASPVAAVGGENAAPHMRVAPTTPRPALKTPKPGTWPFAPWSYAKAYTYNFFPPQQVEGLLDIVTSGGTWNTHIRSEQLISDKQALTAAGLVDQSKGSFETSKCIVPRHAIVLFDHNDKPVGAASVCFECEGILVWPNYKRPDDFDYEAGEKRFLAALAAWKTLFRDELGLPVNYRDAS